MSMQQERNKSRPDDVTDTEYTDAELIEWLAIKIAALVARGVDTPIMSPDAWRRVITCAEKGVHKGKGRGAPRTTRWKKLRQEIVVNIARSRRDELHAQGMRLTGANSAEDQAAAEASSMASEVYDLSLAASTIKRLMQSTDI
jgi:hypothetical protein